MEEQLDPVKVRTLRERRAWSQEHLAEVAGLSTRTIQRAEGVGLASLETRRALAAAFDMDVEGLLGPNEPRMSAGHQLGAKLAHLGLAAGVVSGVSGIMYSGLYGHISPLESGVGIGALCTAGGVFHSTLGWLSRRFERAG